MMGMFIANKVFFLHLHKLKDGTIVEHAHPFNKSDDSSPFKTHQHSETGFLFFQNLEILFSIVFLAIVLSIVIKRKKYVIPAFKWQTHKYTLPSHGRAPPIA
jgi:hypothetical protein